MQKLGIDPDKADPLNSLSCKEPPWLRKKFSVPDLGDFKDVAVIDVLVKPGDTSQVDTPLLTLETEKATMDVPSPDAGVIEKLHVSKGARVSAGSLIATLKRAGAGCGRCCRGQASGECRRPRLRASRRRRGHRRRRRAPAPQRAAPPGRARRSRRQRACAGGARRRAAGRSARTRFARAHASPSVRNFARELGVDLLRSVRAAGRKGASPRRTSRRFVKSVHAGGAQRQAAASAARWPEDQRAGLRPVRRHRESSRSVACSASRAAACMPAG